MAHPKPATHKEHTTVIYLRHQLKTSVACGHCPPRAKYCSSTVTTHHSAAARAAAPPLNDIKAGARQKSNGTSEAPRKKVRVHSMKVAQQAASWPSTHASVKCLDSSNILSGNSVHAQHFEHLRLELVTHSLQRWSRWTNSKTQAPAAAQRFLHVRHSACTPPHSYASTQGRAGHAPPSLCRQPSAMHNNTACWAGMLNRRCCHIPWHHPATSGCWACRTPAAAGSPIHNYVFKAAPCPACPKQPACRECMQHHY